MATCALLVPVAWALGLVSMLSVVVHEQQGPSCVGTCQSLCSAAGSMLGHLRCLLDVQKQVAASRHGAWWLGGASWAAVVAHPGDLGLAAAVFMPQLLMLLLVAQLLARCLAGQQGIPPSAASHGAAEQASAIASSTTLASRMTTVNTGAALLAVAQMLPLVCSMLGMVMGWVGLQRQFPAAQALQLLHPLTPALLGIMTCISQDDAPQALAISALHAVLAGILLATSRAPQSPGYLTPVQAWVALVLLNVVLPAVVAWRRQSATAALAASDSEASTPAAAAAGPASSDHAALEDSTQSQHGCSTQTPSKPMHKTQGNDPSHLSAAAAYDAHMLQPSTPLPQDSSLSPSRRHYTPSPAAAAAAAAAASSSREARLQGSSHSHPDDQGAQQLAATPLLSFEEALAACARGYAARQAAGSAAGTALYHSKLHHHVVSIKAALDDAQEGQELVQLVINHLNTAQATHSHATAAACSTGSSSPQAHPASPAPLGSPLMLRPVAMRGCLHLLLPVCTTPIRASAAAGKQDTGCVLDSPLAAVLQQISKPRVVQKALFADASQQAGPAQGRSIQLHIQIDSSEPQLVVRRPDGMWRVGADSNSASSAAASATSSNSPKHAVTEHSSSKTLQDSSTKCWLEPACVMVGPQQLSSSSTPVGSPGATAGPVSSPAGRSMGRPCVVVKGLPAEVGSLVRVLLVQREAVLADQLLPASTVDDGGGLRSVRLPLPASGLLSGPAMVCVLAPPSSIATAGSAPAGVSPAVAALMMQQQPGQQAGGYSRAPAEQLKTARMWAYLPLLLVDTAEAERELSTLFVDMSAESVSAQGARPQPGTKQAPSLEHSGGTSSGSGSSSMGVQLAHAQHLQPFLWDWLYAVHGAEAASVLATLPELAAQFRGKAGNPTGTMGSLYERAIVWRSTAGSSTSSISSSSNSSMDDSSKQTITSSLLELLASRNMPAAIKQLQAAATRSQPLSPAAGQLAGSPVGTAAATAASPSTQALSPGTASRHDSCESYNHVGAAGGLSGWRAPVHCKDAATPMLSLRKQALQDQQSKYVHTLEDEAAAVHARLPLPPQHVQPLLLQEQHAHTGGSRAGSVAGSVGSAGIEEVPGRQPASRRASSAPTAAAAAAQASSAGLFSPALRRMSLDSLPLPQSAMPAASQLHPPRWSVDLPVASYQQQHAQQAQLFIPPSALYGASSMFSTTSPTSLMGPLGAGEHRFGLQGQAAATSTPRGTPPLAPAVAGGAAAAAAAGAAAAQAALLQLHPGSLNISGASLPSPGMRPLHPSSSGSASNLRFAQQASPNASALHMQPQPSLGYSPSLASSSSAAFMTAEGAGVGGYGVAAPGRVPAGAAQAPQHQQAAGEDAVLEGRHWAVFDTTGVEGFDQGLNTAATNLVTTTGRNSASTVTWLAIPTSQAGMGLPPAALRTPRAARKSGSLYSSSTGKLLHRPSDSHHTVSSSLTPQPPRSRSSWSRHTLGTAESAEFLASSSGTIPMPPGSRPGGPRTSLFHSSTDAAASAGTAGSHFQSCSPEDLASPPARAGRGAGAAVPAGASSRHVSGFSTPQRPGPARFMGASPRRGALWSPGGAQLTTLPTIGSEDSWDQNALMPSPGPDGGVGPQRSGLTDQQQQQLAGMTPLSALRGGSGGEAWEGSMTPRPNRTLRGPPAAPGSLPRLPPAAVAATPRGAVYRSQQGMLTPGFYASRTGNLVSGTNTLGGEGDTVSGVLQLLAGPDGPDGSSTLRTSNSCVSGFSSSSSSLAGTPEGPHGLQGGFFQGGYFTPVRPPPHRGQAAALLPASARPAGRPAVWATPAALASGRFLVPAGATSGSFAAAAGVSGAGFAGSGAAAAAAAAQQQVPDTPLLKAGRNIAGVVFSSPAPPMAHTMQPPQRRMSTPSHIQSLLPPPGSASKLKPAAALLGSAAVGGSQAPIMRPGSSGGALQPADSSTPPQQSSAAAAAALLQPAPEGSSNRPLTPQASGDTHAESASGALTSTSSMFNTQPPGSFLLSEEDMHTPVQSPRAGGTPTGSPTSSSIFSGGVASSSRLVSSPPPAPARPVPGVVLVPAVEAEELFYTEDGMLLNPEAYTQEGFYYTQEGVIPEGFEEVHMYDM